MTLFEETFLKHKQLALKDLNMNEIFVIEKRTQFKHDLIMFLKNEFEKNVLDAKHMGLSVTDYKIDDWLDPIAEVMINNFAAYLEKIRGQTERDLTPKEPIVKDKI